MNITTTPADLQTLSRLLDHGLELQDDAVEPWIAGLADDERHIVPALRQILLDHQRGTRAAFMAACPKLVDVADEPVAKAGDTAGPYRLLREIGRGGMCVVWLAEQAADDLCRQVAIKLPRSTLSADLVERMARERDTSAMMEHPNVVKLIDAGVDARQGPYLVMEYIDGQSLDTWCETHRLDVLERVRHFYQVIRAVAYVHGRGVVHRDLKPSNVIVSDDGQVHLVDFGIAHVVDGASSTATAARSQRTLTLGYASPEQLQGAAATFASDVFSLGVLLFELLTGRLPHVRDRGQLSELYDPCRTIGPVLAAGLARDKAGYERLCGQLDRILARALAQRPEERYPTAQALALDIEHCLDGDSPAPQLLRSAHNATLNRSPKPPARPPEPLQPPRLHDLDPVPVRILDERHVAHLALLGPLDVGDAMPIEPRDRGIEIGY
jgi:eukaryotic-like serine/threonine-protein kinase